MPLVEVPGFADPVSFPDEMSPQDISAAIKKQLQPRPQPPAELNPPMPPMAGGAASIGPRPRSMADTIDDLSKGASSLVDKALPYAPAALATAALGPLALEGEAAGAAAAPALRIPLALGRGFLGSKAGGAIGKTIGEPRLGAEIGGVLGGIGPRGVYGLLSRLTGLGGGAVGGGAAGAVEGAAESGAEGAAETAAPRVSSLVRAEREAATLKRMIGDATMKLNTAADPVEREMARKTIARLTSQLGTRSVKIAGASEAPSSLLVEP